MNSLVWINEWVAYATESLRPEPTQKKWSGSGIFLKACIFSELTFIKVDENLCFYEYLKVRKKEYSLRIFFFNTIKTQIPTPFFFFYYFAFFQLLL